LNQTSRAAPPSFRFDLAGPNDDPEFRRLLRENTMGKAVRIGFHREPDASLSGTVEGPLLHQIVIARRAGEEELATGCMIDPAYAEFCGKDRLFAASTRSLREVYINGVPAVVGYLGSLRIDGVARKSPSLVRRGFEFLRTLHEADLKKSAEAKQSQTQPQVQDQSHTTHPATRLYFTSILADNRPAIRLLESGVTGMPTYRRIANYTTLLIPVSAVSGTMKTRPKTNPQLADTGTVLIGSDTTRTAIAGLVHQTASTRQFASVWREHDLDSSHMARGLKMEDYRLILRDGRPAACCALWDQRGFKQTHIQYAGGRLANQGMTMISKALNTAVKSAASTLGVDIPQPMLPHAGVLSAAYVSHLSTDPASPLAQQTEDAVTLVSRLCNDAAARGIDWLTVGANSTDPVIVALEKAFHTQKLSSHIYAVYWPDGEADFTSLDRRFPCSPDLAVL
jgi:hypothetical protein